MAVAWWIEQASTSLQPRPPFPAEFKHEFDVQTSSAGQWTYGTGQISRHIPADGQDRTYTYRGHTYPSLVSLKAELLDDWDAHYPKLSPTDPHVQQANSALQSPELLSQLWSTQDPPPAGSLPARLTTVLTQDAFGSIISHHAERESLAAALPAALFPLQRGGMPVASNLLLLHASSAIHMQRVGIIWNAIIMDGSTSVAPDTAPAGGRSEPKLQGTQQPKPPLLSGKPYFLKTATNKRKSKVAPLRTGLSAHRVQALWALLTNLLAPDKAQGELERCERLMLMLLTTNWARLPPGALEQSAIWVHAHGGGTDGAHAAARSLWELMLACTLGRAAATIADDVDDVHIDGSRSSVQALEPLQEADLRLLAEALAWNLPAGASLLSLLSARPTASGGDGGEEAEDAGEEDEGEDADEGEEETCITSTSTTADARSAIPDTQATAPSIASQLSAADADAAQALGGKALSPPASGLADSASLTAPASTPASHLQATAEPVPGSKDMPSASAAIAQDAKAQVQAASSSSRVQEDAVSAATQAAAAAAGAAAVDGVNVMHDSSALPATSSGRPPFGPLPPQNALRKPRKYFVSSHAQLQNPSKCVVVPSAPEPMPTWQLIEPGQLQQQFMNLPTDTYHDPSGMPGVYARDAVSGAEYVNGGQGRQMAAGGVDGVSPMLAHDDNSSALQDGYKGPADAQYVLYSKLDPLHRGQDAFGLVVQAGAGAAPEAPQPTGYDSRPNPYAQHPFYTQGTQPILPTSLHKQQQQRQQQQQQQQGEAHMQSPTHHHMASIAQAAAHGQGAAAQGVHPLRMLQGSVPIAYLPGSTSSPPTAVRMPAYGGAVGAVSQGSVQAAGAAAVSQHATDPYALHPFRLQQQMQMQMHYQPHLLQQAWGTHLTSPMHPQQQQQQPHQQQQQQPHQQQQQQYLGAQWADSAVQCSTSSVQTMVAQAVHAGQHSPMAAAHAQMHVYAVQSASPYRRAG